MACIVPDSRWGIMVLIQHKGTPETGHSQTEHSQFMPFKQSEKGFWPREEGGYKNPFLINDLL